MDTWKAQLVGFTQSDLNNLDLCAHRPQCKRKSSIFKITIITGLKNPINIIIIALGRRSKQDFQFSVQSH